jgi:hypothetical protein
MKSFKIQRMKQSLLGLLVMVLFFWTINPVSSQNNSGKKKFKTRTENSSRSVVQKNDSKVLLVNEAIMADPTICYGFDDDTNHLITMTRSAGAQTDLGVSNAVNVEAIMMGLNGDTLYGANNGIFGYFDLPSPTFITIGTFGSGSNGSTTKTMSDVDGLCVDPTTGIFYGTHRDGDGGSPADILFKINKATGKVLIDGFGSNEYVPVTPIVYNTTTYYDIDDIAIDPTDGQMFAIANNGGGTNLLIKVNKATGATTLVNRFRTNATTFLSDVEGLSFYNDGTLYATTGTRPSQLYTINKTTAIATLVGQYTVGGDYEGVACLTRGIITANDDVSLNNTFGTSVMINILTNDIINATSTAPNPSQVTVDIDPSTPGNQSTLVVSGEGTWTYNPSSGIATFTPLSTFYGDPSPIPYTLTENSTGETDNAIITITYVDTPKMSITKEANPSGEVDPGETISYTITMNNIGNVDLTDITLIDNLPSGVTYTANSTVVVIENAETIDSVRDEFNSSGLNNNDGSENWKTSWTFNDPFGGYVGIAGGELFIEEAYVGVANEWATRTVDLTNVTTARLQFDWRTVGLDNGESISVQVSTSTSSGFTTIGSFIGSNTGSFDQSILSYASANTTIRFINLSQDWEQNEIVYFDNVQIVYTKGGDDTRTNAISGGTLSSGVPSTVITTNDNIDLVVGQSLTATFDVVVDAGATGDLTNVALGNASNFNGPVQATVTNPVTSYNISGTIFDDGNAGTVNGSGLGNPDMTPLYANLVDGSGNVVGVATVNPNGTYTIDEVYPGNYTVLISTIQGTVGNAAPSSILPLGWNNTNEGQGPNAAGDGNANGAQSVTITNSDLVNIDFGINKAPVASDVTKASQVNPGGTTEVTAGAPSVTDLEDGTPTTITIKTLPTDGSILYYNGVAVTANQTITNFNASLLTIDPADGAVSPEYTYTTTDEAGVESNVATVTQPFTTVSISGTVFDDGNAGTVNGSGLGNPDMTPLYANLVDGSGTVVGVTQVNNDGTYSISGVTPGNYQVVLSMTQGVVGQGTPDASLPAGWNNTNEGIGPDATGDGIANGVLNITVPTNDLTNVDFGINDAPVASDVTEASQVNPGGTTEVTAGAPNVTDTEDGTPTTITIKSLPTDGSILYYNGTAVTANQTITGFNPALLTIDPADGAVSPQYTYTTTDAAGVESNEATVTMPFTTVSISGTVFDDGNAGTVNGTGLGNPDMTPLYANLVDGSGTVVGVTQVNNDGTYSISGVTPGNYQVVLTMTQGVVGQGTPDASLPAGWNNTNEGIGPDATGDGTANGVLNITVPTNDLTNVDFGINDAPVASDVTAASQVNPGGINEVTAGAPSVTDLEDGTPTTITIKSLPTDGSILYYNGTAVTANQTITGFNPALLTIDPADGAVSPQYTYTTTDAAGVESNEATVTMPFLCLKLNLRVYLQGALINNGGATGSEGELLMRDDLRVSPFTSQNYIPLQEPYTALNGFTHVGGGGEQASATAFNHSGEDAVVDWVFLEFRNKLDSSQVLLTRSAFVQRDGDVVDVDGLSPLLFCGLPDDTYYIAVRHRNHLGVMTQFPETMTITGIMVDFTNGNNNLSGEFNYGKDHPLGSATYNYTGLSQIDFDLGTRAMWLGDGDQNRKVKYNGTQNDPNITLNDVLFYPTNNGGLYNYDFGYGYYNGDYDMNSKAKYNGTGNDPNLVLNQVLFYPLNTSVLYNFDFLLEQLPR